MFCSLNCFWSCTEVFLQCHASLLQESLDCRLIIMLIHSVFDPFCEYASILRFSLHLSGCLQRRDHRECHCTAKSRESWLWEALCPFVSWLLERTRSLAGAVGAGFGESLARVMLAGVSHYGEITAMNHNAPIFLQVHTPPSYPSSNPPWPKLKSTVTLVQ